MGAAWLGSTADVSSGCGGRVIANRQDLEMKPQILVIDDEQPLCDYLDCYLTRHGFDVTTTTRSDEGLRLLDDHPYQLVILDVVLKDGDGLELLTRIIRAHPALPVLMLTGLGFQEEILLEAKSRGAAGYLSKSLTSTHLLLELHRLLRECGSDPSHRKFRIVGSEASHQ